MNRTFTSVGAFLSATILSSITTAQTITWGPVLPSVAPSDVSTNGTVVYAGNAHQPGVAAINATVNGVNFVGGFQPTGWNGYITGGLNGSTTGDNELNALLANSLAMQTAPAANPSAWGGIRIDNLTALIPGYTYEIQVWFTDQRTGTATNVLYDRTMLLSSAFGGVVLNGGEVTNLGSVVQGPVSGALEADPDNAPAISSPDMMFGTHCTGTFVYDPTDELWLIIQGVHPDPVNVLAPHITALQIRDLSSASHAAYGAGCYNFTLDNSNFMEAFAGTPAAAAALNGNALLYTFAGNGYVTTFIPGGAAALYLPPTAAATIVANGDDVTETFTPTVAPPVPGGSAAQWTVSSNGVLTADAVGNQGNNWTSSLAAIAPATGLAWYNWRDFNPSAANSGKIVWEEVGNTLYVTFNGVYEFNSTNPATFQWQINQLTGDVMTVWVNQAVSVNTTTMVVGATLAGAGSLPTSVSLSTSPPFVMEPAVSMAAMSLSASPAPVISPSTLVTYTIDNVPEFIAGSGLHLSTLFVSLNPLPNGVDLTGILTGLPGCKAYIATVDLAIGLAVTPTATNQVQFTFSAPLFSPGSTIAAQAISLFDPSSPLLNGENGGFVLSNGILSTTQLQ